MKTRNDSNGYLATWCAARTPSESEDRAICEVV